MRHWHRLCMERKLMGLGRKTIKTKIEAKEPMKSLLRVMAASTMLIGGASLYAQNGAGTPVMVRDRDQIREHLDNARARLKANSENFAKRRAYHALRKEVLQTARERMAEIREMDEGNARDEAIAALRAEIRAHLKDLKEQRREAVRERRQNREADQASNTGGEG